jgi:hypothetical protein
MGIAKRGQEPDRAQIPTIKYRRIERISQVGNAGGSVKRPRPGNWGRVALSTPG